MKIGGGFSSSSPCFYYRDIMEQEKEMFKLDRCNMLNIRYYIMEMVDLEYSIEQIISITKHSKRQVEKIVRDYSDFKKKKYLNPVVYFDNYYNMKDSMFSKDEMHYGSTGINDKYHYDILSPAEKKIYRKLIYEDEKAGKEIKKD